MSLGVRLHGGGIFCACMRRSKDTSVKSNWRIFGMAIGLLALIVVSGAVGFIYGAIASNTKGGPFYRARVGERITMQSISKHFIGICHRLKRLPR